MLRPCEATQLANMTCRGDEARVQTQRLAALNPAAPCATPQVHTGGTKQLGLGKVQPQQRPEHSIPGLMALLDTRPTPQPGYSQSDGHS